MSKCGEFNNAALDLLTALLTLALRRKKARAVVARAVRALGAAVGTAYPLLPAPAKICAAVLLPLVMTAGFHKFASFADMSSRWACSSCSPLRREERYSPPSP